MIVDLRWRLHPKYATVPDLFTPPFINLFKHALKLFEQHYINYMINNILITIITSSAYIVQLIIFVLNHLTLIIL